MVSAAQYKRILVGKASNGLGVVRGHDHLSARLKRLTKSHHKVPDFRQRKIVVGFIPKTKYLAIGIDSRKHESAYHEALLAIGQILERETHVSLAVGELDDKASGVSANHRILNVFQVRHHLLEILVDLGISIWRVGKKFRKPGAKVSDVKIRL
jgi:hypothetical protein